MESSSLNGNLLGLTGCEGDEVLRLESTSEKADLHTLEGNLDTYDMISQV
jgi:hypothetical protein